VKQAAVWAAIVLGMLFVGVSTYDTVASLRGGGWTVQRPSASLVSLPGTIYVAQGGAIYRLRAGSFNQLTPAEGWTQPAVSRDGRKVVAVKEAPNSSDLYLLTAAGQVVAQLTHNASRTVEANHWAFYPRFSPDGSAVFYSYDPKDPGNTYRVDLAIFSRPADPTRAEATAWTQPNQYTGGDATPVPVPGGLIYTRFSIDEHSQVHSQVWLQAQAGSQGGALTPAGDDCSQPAVSPDARRLAMVCTHGNLAGTQLEVAQLDLESLSIGAPNTLVSGELIASPAFSWDGLNLAYLAPAQAGGSFQLWTVTASGPAGRPLQVTASVGFDSRSAPAWVSGTQ
jgi:Tol biopolymer transport system component